MKKRITLTDKEMGTIHRLLTSWTPETRPNLIVDSTPQQQEDWHTLSNLTHRACGNECFCGDSCTCGG